MVYGRPEGISNFAAHIMKLAITSLLAVLLIGPAVVWAQDEESGLAVRINNRSCADLSVRLSDGNVCSEAFEICNAVIATGKRGELPLKTGAFPMSLTLQVSGRCTPEDRAVVSGSCQANLFSQVQRSIHDPSSGRLDDLVRGVCNDINVDCPGIEEFREPSRFRHRTVDIELGICDAGPGGVDVCLPECTVP